LFITLLFTIKSRLFTICRIVQNISSCLASCKVSTISLSTLPHNRHHRSHPCNDRFCKPYSACICRVYVLYFKLPAHQIGSKVSAKASGIFKSKYNFLCAANLPNILNKCRYLDGLFSKLISPSLFIQQSITTAQWISLCISIQQQVFRL